jgi:hypothetical protein
VAYTIRAQYSDLEKYQRLMKEGDGNVNSLKFNIFNFAKIVGRKKTLPLLALELFV